MPQLTKSLENYEKPGIVVRYKVAPATTIQKGSLVGVNADGLVVPLNPATANLTFIGVSNDFATEGKHVLITKSGSFVFPNTGLNTQAQIGKVAFATGDGSVSPSNSGLTNAYTVGTIIGLESASSGEAGLRIRIDRHTS